MAKEADKDGHMTLGVLTKPDLVDDGARTRIMDLTMGTRQKLALVCRLPTLKGLWVVSNLQHVREGR